MLKNPNPVQLHLLRNGRELIATLRDKSRKSEQANGFSPTLLSGIITATLVVIELVDKGEKGVEMFNRKSELKGNHIVGDAGGCGTMGNEHDGFGATEL